MPQLRIVVLVKQVPDTANVTGEAMKEDGTINRAALPAVFNPEDLNALEEALKLKDRHDARVTVLTMGPPAAVQVLRAVAVPRRRRGAHPCSPTRAFAGADTLATSYALSLAVEKLGGADVRALRPPGDRRRHGAGRLPADSREAGLSADPRVSAASTSWSLRRPASAAR